MPKNELNTPPEKSQFLALLSHHLSQVYPKMGFHLEKGDTKRASAILVANGRAIMDRPISGEHPSRPALITTAQEAGILRLKEYRHIRHLQKMNEQREKSAQRTARIAHDKEKLIQSVAHWPKLSRPRLRTMLKLNPFEWSTLVTAGVLTEDDRKKAQAAQASSVFIAEVAELLDVRTSDVERWDADQRLPHATTKTLRIQGKAIQGRVWLMEDIDAAAPKVLLWLTNDLAAKRARATPNLKKILKRLEDRPARFKPSTAKAQATLQKAAEAKAQKALLARQNVQLRAVIHQKQEHKKRVQEAHQQQIQKVVAMRGDGHWDQFFKNPMIGSRRMEAYLGPTNSGKTHAALQALKTLKGHQRGIYLAPLRLLAIEVCEELRSQGVAASLVTGEERDIDPQARVVCSTIEMMDVSQHYDVGVIDEMQMVADPQRGWAWTQALFDLSADHLFVLGSPAVEKVLHDFSETTGEALTVHHTQRFTALQVHAHPVSPKSITKGTVFVVFSRNAVIRWGEYFRVSGHTVAQIYGAMPPEVRREEARRFRAGEADILVATDAVAMGLNLPAHTVVLGEGEKYDGHGQVPVPGPLIRQIAGRAGRFGHHDAGFAAGADSAIHHRLHRALNGCDKAFTFPHLYISPPRQWVESILEDAPEISLQGLLEAWTEIVRDSRWFRCMEMSEMREKAYILDNIENSGRLPMVERLQILTAPVDVRAGQMQHFRLMVQAILKQQPLACPSAGIGPHAHTDVLESAYKHLSLYSWFHYRYPQTFPEIGKAVSEKARCVQQLITQIRRGLKRHCKECGKIISAKSGYGICDACYQARRRDSWDRAYYG